MPSPSQRLLTIRTRTLQRTGQLLFLSGVLLIVLNVVGNWVPLRGSDVTGYLDFAGVATSEADETLDRLEQLNKSMSTVDLVFETTKILHEGIAHIDPQDVIDNGLDHYRMSVPATENWVLYLLRFLKPDTYQDYEFCSYRRAVERGIGRCGQQALAAVSYLQTRGINTGFVALGGHAIATAEVLPGTWHLLDPDFGGVIPFGIDVAEKSPADTLIYYWSTAATERRLDLAYATPNRLKLGGVEARYGRACYIEELAYILKWFVPLLMLIVATLAMRRHKVLA